MTDKLLLSDINKHDCFVGFSRRSISLDTPTDILSIMLSIGSGETSYCLYTMSIRIPFTGLINTESMGNSIKYRINEVDAYRQSKSTILGVETVYVKLSEPRSPDIHKNYIYTSINVYTLNPLDIGQEYPRLDGSYFFDTDVRLYVINLLLGIQIK